MPARIVLKNPSILTDSEDFEIAIIGQAPRKAAYLQMILFG